MLRICIVLMLCALLAILGCTSDSQGTTSTAAPSPTSLPIQTPSISDQEVIGIVQTYLEGRVISLQYRAGRSISFSEHSSSTSYGYRDVDCRTRALEIMNRWEASQGENGAWIVLAHGTETWEWRLFPSGVITTISGPC